MILFEWNTITVYFYVFCSMEHYPNNLLNQEIFLLTIYVFKRIKSDANHRTSVNNRQSNSRLTEQGVSHL